MRLVWTEARLSSGVLGGRGGGGGPGLAKLEPEAARLRDGRLGPGIWAYFPASAIGGGARNLGRGGDGSRLGDWAGDCSRGGGGDGGASGRPRLAGGGGGGAPRLPVFCGLIGWDFDTCGGGTEGGGGGGTLALFVVSWEAASVPEPLSSLACCFCSIYALIKSEFSAICSSVIPIAFSSSRRPRHDGSTVSSGEDAFSLFPGATGAEGAVLAGGCLGGMIDSAGFGADEDLCPCRRLPTLPKRLWLLPFDTGVGVCPRAAENGVALVSLLALFSRSVTFLRNVFASFSSAKERPARQSSSSKV